MAYHTDETDEGAIVMDGVAGGIAASPYEGISDMRNMNIIPIPDEASVNFATIAATFSNGTNTINSADASADTITITGILGNGQAIVIAGSTLPGGISAATTYWAF